MEKGIEMSNVSEEAYSPDMDNETNQTNGQSTAEGLTTSGKSVFVDFTERTTFHGIRYIAEEGSIWRR